MKKLLFVCLGNICRSPSAENIMNYLVEKEGLSNKIRCDSAGTCSYHLGAPPDSRMRVAARKRGLELKGEARQIEFFDLEYFDLILAMDKSNHYEITSLDLQRQYQHKVKLICEFATQHDDREVPDPYYGGQEGFNYVIDLLFDACEGLLNYCEQLN